MGNNWNSFRLRVNINQPPDKVFAAISTPAGLESWFLRRAAFSGASGDERIRPGEAYEWLWHGYPDNVAVKGSVTAVDGSVFAFTFSMGSLVSISTYRECDETIVELVESGLPTDEETMMKHYVGDSKGWIFYLVNLKSVLEGGLDLRNRKEELKNVITA
ncbi:MAG TPA: SRPBCC domain-containing protein [Puia sp.]|nr:SRPBCC domain-containing protein [Puia sp.]